MHSRSAAIHTNPNFLYNKPLERGMLQIPQTNLGKEDSTEMSTVSDDIGESLLATVDGSNATPRKIVKKTRTCIIREPAPPAKSSNLGSVAVSGPLIRLSRHELVRVPPTNITPITTSVNPQLTSVTTFSKFTAPVTAANKYKVDNREKLMASAASKTVQPGSARRSFVTRYALRHCALGQESRKSPPLKTKSPFKLQPPEGTNQWQMLNINGVPYKSTRNKLQRKETEMTTPAQKNASLSSSTSTSAAVETSRKSMGDRNIFVRGTKFVLDANGYKLTRVAAATDSSTSSSPQSIAKPLQRIDIGGRTYVASKSENVLVRTSNHLAQAHLNTAKQRSVQVLTSPLMKTNSPCAIFRRIGKCSAHKRGRCNKVHDKKQVSICRRFLRNECHDPNCLLSHNVSLAKMPLCKFFSQCRCEREDCPYLHKKLSTNADVCMEFLRGYCKEAEQCNKRHEFICPEYARKGECKIEHCTYCSAGNKRKALHHRTISAKKSEMKEAKTAAPIGNKGDDTLGTKDNFRYFYDKTSTLNNDGDDAANTDKISDAHLETDLNALENEAATVIHVAVGRDRPKVGLLPAFIPIT